MEAAEHSRVVRRRPRGELEQDLRDAEDCCTELVKLAELQAERLEELRHDQQAAARSRRCDRWLGAALLALVVVCLLLSTGCAGAPFESSTLDGSPLAGAQSSAGAPAAGSPAGISGGAGGGAGGRPAGGSNQETPEAPGGAGGAVLGAAGEGGAPLELAPCDTSTWQASAFASSVQSTPALAVDADEHTRWTSGEERQAGQWFELDLGAGVVLEQLEIRTSESPNDMPRAAELELDGVRVEATATAADGVLRFTFAATPATSARVVLTENAQLWWSIASVGGLCK